MLFERNIGVKSQLDSRKNLAYSGKSNAQNISKNKVALKSENSSGRSFSTLGSSSLVDPNKKNVAFTGVEKITIRNGYFKEFKNSLLVKKFDEVVGTFTGGIAVGGFFLGGTGLIYDSMVKKARGKDKNHNDNAVKEMPLLKQVKTEVAQKYNLKDIKDSSKKSGSGEGYGDITPETKFGKIGLTSAKAAISVSGVAGALTGVAARVPLMVAGEAVGNVLSAPIINTFAGFGLMNIGMGCLISGRSLEKNVNTTLDPVKFAAKSPMGKVKYIGNNIWMGVKETGKSIGEIGKNVGRLLSFNKEKINEAGHFFKNNFFSLKPTIIQLEQNIKTNGKTVAEIGMKSSPHFLQFGGGILALSGIVMVGESILEKIGVIKKDKSDKAREACFVGGKAGQIADNVSLAKYGMETMAKGSPALGIPVLASGATALVGAPHVDKDYGKGIIWGALSLFFTFITLERGIGWKNALNAKKDLMKNGVVDATAGFVKSFNLDTSRIPGLKGKDRKNLLYALDAQDKNWPNFLGIFSNKAAKKAETNMKNKVHNGQEYVSNSDLPIYNEIMKFKKHSKEILSDKQKHYDPDYNAKNLVQDLAKAKDEKGQKIFSNEFIDYADKYLEMNNHIGKKDVGDVIKSNIYADSAIGGKGYKENILKPIVNNPNTPDWVKTPINEAMEIPKINKSLEK